MKEKETPLQTASLAADTETAGSTGDQEKSSAAYRTIGEVAAELGLPSHVLRFWESKFTQIKPHKRRGGHRYYRPADVDALREIKFLLYERGYTIKGAQKHLRDLRKARSEALVGSMNDNHAEADANHGHAGALQDALSEMLKLRKILEMSS